MKLLVFFVICVIGWVLPVSSSTHVGCDKDCQRNYLVKYGYILPIANNEIGNLETMDLSEGIVKLQHEAGIEETGSLNAQTINLLQTPRCDVKWSRMTSRRQKRFVIVRKWDTDVNHLNETIISWYLDLSNFEQIKNENLSKEIIQSIFSTAIHKWAKTSLIYFKEVLNEADANITIKFLEGSHGDGYDFDGPGKLLAHAFYPGSERGGDAHFDLGETWTLWKEESGISLFHVAIHEIGHSIGLGHSSQLDSIMYAWFNPKNMELSEDDRIATNSLYGVRPQFKFGSKGPKHTTTTTTTTIKPKVRHPTKYNMDYIKKLSIINSKVFIYPKSTSTLSF
jgi:hypothetical protein